MVAATTFLSCKNEVNDPVSKEIEFKNEKELSLILPEKYEEIGINHNDMLNDFYFNNANRQILNAKVSYKDFSIEEYFGRIDKKYYFKDMIYDFSRNASNDVSVTETLVRNELLTEEGAEYISKIESKNKKENQSIQKLNKKCKRLKTVNQALLVGLAISLLINFIF